MHLGYFGHQYGSFGPFGWTELIDYLTKQVAYSDFSLVEFEPAQFDRTWVPEFDHYSDVFDHRDRNDLCVDFGIVPE